MSGVQTIEPLDLCSSWRSMRRRPGRDATGWTKTFCVSKRPSEMLTINNTEAKSRKYRGVFKVKSRVKTWQVRGIWSQQLEHKQSPKRGTEQGVQKGKRSLMACHTRCKCSMETTNNSVKVKLGMKVMKFVESLICW